ncbi:hypothetical protein Patl1_08459 [Pistacia atlantica]|uniref:Uncharacterized protein n=1 Tax=Pistacia atlantica TaxID=434234 RepID=A0ACC1ADW7_9ROSI|nr:hypothetical protein Patl1_08459 [Pistacia atlantica]
MSSETRIDPTSYLMIAWYWSVLHRSPQTSRSSRYSCGVIQLEHLNERGCLESSRMLLVGAQLHILAFSYSNGVLSGNQRPPYNLKQPFGAKDKRSQA